MEKEEIKRKVYNILHKNEFVDIQDHSHLSDDLGMDSLDTVEFAVDLEKEFNIVIEDEDMEKIHHQTVNHVIDLLYKIIK